MPDVGRDRRLLFLAATAKDAATTERMLTPLGIRVDVCRSVTPLLHEISAGVGAVLMPEEAISSAQDAGLGAILAQQPPWSDLPLLVLTLVGADSADTAQAVRTLGNVTLLERPVRFATLVSAVRTAIRARERQYQIREHLAERRRAEEVLRAADQRKDEFLATLGHELRNPLAPLVTALHLLKNTVSDETTVEIAQLMERQLSHLIRLVDDLLEVSRITRGLVEVQRENLDLTSIVRTAVEASKPVLDAAGHTLTVDCPADSMGVNGDAVRLIQVFANILTNAAKYTNAGGHVQIQLRRVGDRAIVSVRDNGIGLAADQLTSVFEMFTQVDRSDRRAQGGLGIGLTLVKSLVALHGGSVEARSPGLGQGSEFVVELPLSNRAVALLEGSQGLAGIPPRRILVVDDNRDAAETMGELLTSLGATAAVVNNGQDALDTVAVFQPDVVLLDIGMPGMNGYEVARRIRARQECRNTLLIALTGWGQAQDQRRSREAGFDHHMIKPPDLAKLRQILGGPASGDQEVPTHASAKDRAVAPD